MRTGRGAPLRTRLAAVALLCVGAAAQDVDPWIRVSRLLDAGNAEEAARLVETLPEHPEKEALRKYVDARRAGAPDGVAETLSLAEKAQTLLQAGDGRGAAQQLAEAGAAAARIGWHSQAIAFARAGGNLARRAGDYDLALELWERRLAGARTLQDADGVLGALRDLGSLCGLIGDYDGAMERFEAGLAIVQGGGDPARTVPFLQNMALIHEIRGRYGQAQTLVERALDATAEDDRLRPDLLLQLARSLSHLGDYDDALRRVEEARRLFEARGDAVGAGRCLGEAGNVHGDAEQYEQMLDFARRAAAHFHDAEDPERKSYLAAALSNMGLALTYLGRHAEALEAGEKALALATTLRDPRRLADVRQNVGFAAFEAGDLPRAEKEFGEALALGDLQAAPRVLALARSGLARVRFAQGRLDEAAREADAAMAAIEMEVAGLAEGHGAAARARHARIFRVAVEIAAARERPADVFAALERGRAMALLESLEARDAIREARIPADLREAENEARRAVRRAQFQYERAMAGGERKAVRACRDALDASWAQVEEVVRRIQRDARAGAANLYPRPIALDDARRLLGPKDAFVGYAVLEDRVVALVVTQGEARLAPVGERPAVEAACAAIAGNPEEAARGACLVDTLALPDAVDRVLVSPDGALFGVPFVVLLPKREVSYVPSATTWARLREHTRARGEGVLAVGDPVVETAAGPGLTRLPASAVEARTVGSRVLLRDDATIAGFREALAGKPRWRAVHFACHGLVDPKHEMRSALALTPTEQSNGRLTALDLCELTVPADLVVLSGCETARGRAYEGEGLVGLARASLVAGASGALVSLWKVDDEATRALMASFYGLWNPADERPAVPAATALRRAMEFVRHHPEHPEWSQPRFWAAWQLWGVPD